MKNLSLISASTLISFLLIIHSGAYAAPEVQDHTPNYTTVDTAWQSHQLTVGKNDTLSNVLYRIGVKANQVYRIDKAKNSRLITQLRRGDTLHAWVDDQNQLQRLTYDKSRTKTIEVVRIGKDFQINQIDHPIETRTVSAIGNIENSFYLSGKAAGLSAKTIMNLADIFGWEIDFVRELRQKDEFRLIYEKRYLNGEYIGDGEILAAQITTNNKKGFHQAYLLKDKDNQNLGYFDENHNSLKKAFLRNPVDYVRITSGYSPRRFHPVLKKWKPHLGIDYGGPIGTPIRSTGDGKILKRYYSKSYGNVIFVQHGGKYTTVYAHLSRFAKYRVGQTVKQGQVIGYLGSTGWSTGPHLHYEFRVNGKSKDPMKVKFPNSKPVPQVYRQQFNQYAQLMQDRMQRLSEHTQFAGYFE